MVGVARSCDSMTLYSHPMGALVGLLTMVSAVAGTAIGIVRGGVNSEPSRLDHALADDSLAPTLVLMAGGMAQRP